MKKTIFVIVITILCIISLNAQQIRLGSIMPKNTPWDGAIKAMGNDWRQISNGRIRLTVFAGGIAGDEADMIRKMNIGGLDAAALTPMGLYRIEPDALVLSLPFQTENDDELFYLIDKMAPTLNKKLEDQGYVVLQWVMAGWTYFFSRDPIITPDDLRRQKITVTKGDDFMQQVWKSMNFNVVPLAPTENMSGLQSGMIDAFFSVPLATAAYQWFGLADDMCDMRIGPLAGALVINARSWNRINNNIKDDLLESATRHLKPLYQNTKELDAEAIDLMQEYGLTIHHADDNAIQEWRTTAESAVDYIVGNKISTDVYEMVQEYLHEFRTNN